MSTRTDRLTPTAARSATRLATPDAGHTVDDAPFTRREWALVLAFWSGWALLSVANRVLDPVGVIAHAADVGSALAVAAIEALGWALLTPVLFHLTARAGTPQTPWPIRLGIFGAGGIVVALAFSVLGGELRHVMGPAGAGGLGGPGGPPFGGPPGGLPIGPTGGPGGAAPPLHGPPRPPDDGGGPPIWFEFVNALVLYLGVLAAGSARAYALRYRARHEQALRLHHALDRARLDALRRQLDPHFLFNTLNAVASLVDHDPPGVRRMIARLGDLLRFSFDESGDPEIPLRRELALVDRYVEIMQVRFQGGLTVHRDVDDRALDLLVPAMILQPLVENAIKHGVERVDGGGTVTIAAALDGDALVLAVQDDGPGLDTALAGAQVTSQPTPSGGVGLRNTIARVEQLYAPLDGPRPRFALRPAPGGGTIAELRLPVRRAAVAGEANTTTVPAARRA